MNFDAENIFDVCMNDNLHNMVDMIKNNVRKIIMRANVLFSRGFGGRPQERKDQFDVSPEA